MIFQSNAILCGANFNKKRKPMTSFFRAFENAIIF